MLIHSSVWDNVWSRLELLFDKMARMISSSIPNLHWVCGRGANEAFPFRSYATFENGDKVIDVSVDCKLSGELLYICADIAREQGFVLADTPITEISLQQAESTIVSQIETAINQIEEMLVQHIALIEEELA